METDGRPARWTCKCGYTLGLVPERPRKVRSLVLLPRAWPPTDWPPKTLVEASLVTLTGKAVVRCSRCGRTRTWHAAAYATQDFLERRAARKEQSDG
ncbi:MAG: hypothetical protein KIT46_04580 [Anaerolineales bacterium]|nr:hypothetical protein [Anaerolineales bacterium]MCW5855306.1 hypothetical protein [Anaerolineales bacterium]